MTNRYDIIIVSRLGKPKVTDWQDPASVGTAFKTISMRIRGAKTEMEAAGLETEGMVESTAKLREEIMALTGVDIMLNENEFKSTYAIMEELAGKWKDLTDIQQASVTELIAGKRQGNIVSSLMTNFDIAQDALQTSLDSSGSAMKEHEKWMESLEARLLRLKAAWQNLSQAFMSSDFLKGALDVVIKLVEGITELIEAIGVVPTLLGGFAAFKILATGFTHRSAIFGLADVLDVLSIAFPSTSKGISTFITKLNGAGTAAKGSSTVLSGLSAVLSGLNPVAIAGVAAVGLLGYAYFKAKKDAKELSEEVGKLTSEYRDQHEELIKTKDDYDTSNEDSMISKYEELSKGVDSLGKNVALTADEYSEYQSIVNQIAEQIPSLVTGYNSQGDAILNCAGNVDKLTEAYKNLIKEQNDEVLDAGEDVFKDFENKIKDSSMRYTGGDDSLYNANHLNELEKFINLNGEDLDTAIEKLSISEAERISRLLEEYGKERNVLGSGENGWEDSRNHIIRVLNEDKAEIKSILDKASEDINAYAENMGSVTEAYFSTAFIGGGSGIGDYSHMSEEIQNVINQITSGFDSEFYAKFLDDENPYESLTKYFDDLLTSFDSLNTEDKTKLEAVFDLKTKFNNGEVSYGEYVDGIKNAGNVIDSLNLNEDVENDIKLSIGLSEKDGEWSVEEYETLLSRLTSKEYEFQLDTESAKSFIDSLSSEELNVAIKFIGEGNEDFNNALQNYKDVLNEANEAGVNFSKTTYGNIDTNARQVLEWNSENLKKYKDELMSWEADDASWDKVKKSYKDTISTVMGGAETYTIDGKEVDIAFSPMLQTDKGAEVLSKGTVDTYIGSLIEKATKDGKWDAKELIALDAKGLEVDGRKINNILADIGDTAVKTSEQMHFVGKDGALALAKEEFLAIVEAQAKINEAMNFTADIKVDKTALESFNTALEESASAMGLSEESIDSLKAKYSDLESYNYATLFERTANGVKVNREELAKLEKEQNDLTKSKVREHIETLRDAYNDNVVAIDKCSNAAERAQLISDNETYKNQIEELAEYEAQLDGVTGAYQRWIDAQNAPEDYEGYEGIATSREDVEGEISRGFLGNATKEYIDLLSGEDLIGATIDEYAEAWENLDKTVGSTSYSIHDFFTVNDDGDITATGIDRFFEGLKQDFDGSVAKFNEKTGKWQYDFSEKNLEAIQKEWGIGIDAIELMLEAAVSAGYDIDWDGLLDNLDLNTSEFESLISYAESAQNELNKLEGYENLSFNFTTTSIEDATTEIEKAQNAYANLITNKDGSINLKAEGAEQMRMILSTLLVQKQQLQDSNIAISIDTSGLGESQQDIANAIEAVKTFREKYKNLEIAVSTGQGIDEAKTELTNAMKELEGLGGKGVDIAAQLVLGEGTDGSDLKTKVDSAINAVGSKDIKVGCKLDETDLGSLNSQLLTNFTPEATVKITGIEDSLVQGYTSTEKTADGTVTWKNDDKLVVEYSKIKKAAKGTVTWGNDTDDVKKSFSATGTVTWTSGNNVKVNVISQAKGTANAGGTIPSGRAFARGNWGIKGNGTALGGELGQELVVRDGRFFTIGDNGAEFFNYKQNDIVFNAAQTESLFKYGGIKGAKPRGTMLAGGTAFANGNTQISGKAFPWSATGSESGFAGNRKNGTSNTFNYDNPNVYNNDVTRADAKKKSKDTKDEFEETFDWIEVAISRIERAIDRLDQKANRTYKSWSSRNSNLTKEISKVRGEINLQERAYNGYMAEANSVGLSSKWRNKVQDGTIDISTIKDEDLAEKISQYTEWYNKALACKDTILDLQDTEAELYKQRFDNVASKYDAKIERYNSKKSIAEQNIEKDSYKTSIGSLNNKNYKTIVSQEKNTISQLKKEKKELESSLDKAVKSGAITKYSEDWYEMMSTIDDVALSIEESTNNISKAYVDMFDIVGEKYDAMLQGYEHTETMLDEYISQAEAKGHIVSKKYYEALVKNEKNNISTLKKEQSDLIKARDKAVESGAIKKGSLEWYNMCAEIDAVTQALEESTTQLIEFDNAMREIDWSVFDLIQERISGVTAEADFLIELMSNDKLFDDKGKMTNQGIATTALHAQNYNTHMYQADDYGSEVAKLDKQIKKDPYDQELINRRNELIELQRESILAAEDEKQAIVSLIEEGIEIELDALQELIDKKNEELESEKDLYDYQKKVKKQTKEIADIEKTLSAYENDDSEETKAKVQQLKVEFEESKESLEEMEYERYIESQQALLDTLYLEYETILNQRLDNVDALLSQVIDAVNAAASGESAVAIALSQEGAIATILGGAFGEGGSFKTILSTLQTETKGVGTTLSTAMKNIWSVGEGNAKSVLTTYGQGFQNKQTTTNTTLSNIKVGIDKMVAASNKEAATKTSANKTSSSSKKDPTKNTTTKKTSTKTTTTKKTTTKTTTAKKTTTKKSSGGDGKAKIGDKVKFVSGKYYYDSYGTSPSGYYKRGDYVYITHINKSGSHPYHISTGSKLGKGDLGWLKLSQLSGYFTGKRKILNNEYAWTQEKGAEFIVRPSDGAILTPVAKNDSVLNAAASSNIWNMANSPAEFIKDNLGLGVSNIPNDSNVQNSYNQTIESIVFSMPNVKNYDEMLRAMQRDKDFEKLILSMSIDRIAGKSSLAKNKVLK